jgi:Na+-translocating ferredoxin:NAD+ oxidoreductase RnfG subunit
MRKTGIVLLVIGIIMTLITGINFVTTKKVVDLGPVQINKEQNHPVQWSPLIGAALVVVGIGLMVSAKKKSRNN